MKDSLGISEQESRFAQRRENAWNMIKELENPESIKTPGRTWTNYPDVREMVDEEVVPREPELEVSGRAKVLTGEEAMEAAEDKLLKQVKTSENRLNATHTALMNSLVYIKAEERAKVEISYSEEEPLFASLVVETEENAELEIIENFQGNAEFFSTTTEIYAAGNSTVRYRELEGTASKFYHSLNTAETERDAKINWLTANFGAEKLRQLNRTRLAGDNSEVHDQGLFFLSGQQHHDVSKQVKHRAENTECRMNTRGTVRDSSRSVYEGVQDVGEEAPGTSSFQHEETLMLSDKSEADASPKLVIENNDVEATHAAAAGKPSEEKLHYLKSRGLDEREARKLVVKGFYQLLLEEINSEKIVEKLMQKIERKLEE